MYDVNTNILKYNYQRTQQNGITRTQYHERCILPYVYLISKSYVGPSLPLLTYGL